MSLRFRFLPIFCALAVLPGVELLAQGEGSDLSRTAQELEDLRYRIQSHRRKASELADDEKQQLQRLQELEQEQALSEKLLNTLQGRESEIQSEVEKLQAEIGGCTTRLDGRKNQLANHLRSIYKRGQYAGLASVFTARNLSELTARMRILTHIARTERGLIEEVQFDQHQLAVQRAQIEQSLEEIHRNRREMQQRREQLGALSSERKAALTEIKQQKKRHESSVREMEKAAKAMEDLIASMEKKREDARQPSSPSTDFAGMQGRMNWPVSGTVTKPFGKSVHPQFKTVVMNHGVNISAAAGTPIQAVHAGVVEYVNWLPGYGKCIILNHGDGYYSLYAHASLIYPREGGKVLVGDVIAEVGDTGSLNGSQLYFEIRKGRTPLDPGQWLKR